MKTNVLFVAQELQFVSQHSGLLLRAKDRTMSAGPRLTLMNLSGATSLHIFRAKRNERSTSSLLRSGVYLEILHADTKDVQQT